MSIFPLAVAALLNVISSFMWHSFLLYRIFLFISCQTFQKQESLKHDTNAHSLKKLCFGFSWCVWTITGKVQFGEAAYTDNCSKICRRDLPHYIRIIGSSMSHLSIFQLGSILSPSWVDPKENPPHRMPHKRDHHVQGGRTQGCFTALYAGNRCCVQKVRQTM